MKCSNGILFQAWACIWSSRKSPSVPPKVGTISTRSSTHLIRQFLKHLGARIEQPPPLVHLAAPEGIAAWVFGILSENGRPVPLRLQSSYQTAAKRASKLDNDPTMQSRPSQPRVEDVFDTVRSLHRLSFFALMRFRRSFFS